MTSHIYPVARYERARDAIAWLTRAFGFEEQVVHPGPSNTVAHAELRLGTGTIGLSSAGPVDPANVWTTVREGISASVENPDEHHHRAAAAGATIERALADTDYGSREYSVRDHEGHLWSLGTYGMSDMPGSPIFYPELRYNNGVQAVDFLTRAFNLRAGLQVREDGDDVVHAELWLGDGVLMVGAGADPQGLWKGEGNVPTSMSRTRMRITPEPSKPVRASSRHRRTPRTERAATSCRTWKTFSGRSARISQDRPPRDPPGATVLSAQRDASRRSPTYPSHNQCRGLSSRARDAPR